GEVESEHVGDAVGTKRGHEQAVHAERNAGAAGQSVSERCQQVVIDTRIYGAALAPSCEVAFEPRRLLVRVLQFVIAVGSSSGPRNSSKRSATGAGSASPSSALTRASMACEAG